MTYVGAWMAKGRSGGPKKVKKGPRCCICNLEFMPKKEDMVLTSLGCQREHACHQKCSMWYISGAKECPICKAARCAVEAAKKPKRDQVTQYMPGNHPNTLEMMNKEDKA